jgi:RNA polymerase sigma-70 factor (ECF subfamily)
MTEIQFRKKILGIQKNMYHFALTLTANKNDAEDLLQDTTLKVLDNWDKYVDNTNFKGWVLTIMRNIFVNNYRKVLRRQTVIDQTEDLYFLNLSQESELEGPEDTMTMKEIFFVINKLNDELKVPFSMYLAGYKYSEISNRMGLALGTVKSRIFFARKELQKSLQDMRYYI